MTPATNPGTRRQGRRRLNPLLDVANLTLVTLDVGHDRLRLSADRPRRHPHGSEE